MSGSGLTFVVFAVGIVFLSQGVRKLHSMTAYSPAIHNVANHVSLKVGCTWVEYILFVHEMWLKTIVGVGLDDLRKVW
jgi:hypothetical protein